MPEPNPGASTATHRAALAFQAALLVAVALAGPPACAQAAARAPRLLVVCAPGYPGSTLEAQPAMDGLAAAITTAAGWKPGELAGIYFENEAAGVARLAAPEATLALVPLNFWLEHGERLRLQPQLQAIPQGGEAAEAWSLVAQKGAVTSPASLAAFELLSLAGNTPRFVRGPALGAWGPLPPELKIVFSGAVLSGLRRAAAGEKVVLLLDRAQAAAMATLPAAPQLEIVARSPPLPVSVLCTIADRLPASRLHQLVERIPSLGDTPVGVEALAGVRLARFVPVDAQALERARTAYARVSN
ncbi:MAG: hypothetical protein ABI689_03525 [Thermoanaerobaculia bacterium]